MLLIRGMAHTETVSCCSGCCKTLIYSHGDENWGWRAKPILPRFWPMALGRLFILNRKSTQTILLFFFFQFLCVKPFPPAPNKMLINHFTPEIFPLSLLLFFVHTPVSWSPSSSPSLIQPWYKSGFWGWYVWSPWGNILVFQNSKSILLCKCSIWSMLLKLYLICLQP